MTSADSIATNNALKAVANGMSVRQAAKTFRLSRDFIHGRIRGKPLRKDAQKRLQSLSPAQEQSLVDWMLLQARLGWEPPHSRVHLFAQSLFAASGGRNRLGKDWHTRFFKRWPATKSLKKPTVKIPHVITSCWTNTSEFFDRLDHPLLSSIPPSRTYTVAEIGSTIGPGDNTLVVGSAGVRKMCTLVRGMQESVTVMECVSGDGRALKPMAIFRGVEVHPFGKDDFDTLSFDASPCGFASNQVALRWLQDIFLPLTKPDDGGWRHLIVDDDASYLGEDIMLACFKEKVWLDFLPANTLHMLQPLVLGPLPVLKRTYRHQLLQNLAKDSAPNFRTSVFLDAWNTCRKEAFQPQNIQAGWFAAGIFPRDRSRALSNKTTRRIGRSQLSVDPTMTREST